MAEREELKIGALVEFQVQPWQQKSFYARGRVIDEPRLSAGPKWAGYIVPIDMRADKKYCDTFPTRQRTSKRIERVWIVPDPKLGGSKHE